MGEAGAGAGAGEAGDHVGLDRRAFLVSGAAAVTAGVIVAQAPVAFAKSAARALKPVTLSRATFLPLVGTTFKVPGTTSKLTLVEVGDLTGAAAGADSQFSLLFQAAGAELPSTIATLKSTTTTVSLFVAPVDRGAVHQYHQAIVNRID
jgi:hypothetical protein